MGNNLDQNIKITNEDKLLILCARTQLNPEIKSKLIKLFHSDLDWDYLIQRAFQHKLTPLLYWNLKEFKEEVPENVLKCFKESFNRNVKKNLLMLGELLKLVNLFEKHGLNVIPYKGPLLAIYAYKNLALRQFDDLDIFVDKNDVLKVKEILISYGYNPQFELKGFKEKRFIKSQREYKFKNPETNISLEVHWQFQGVSFSLSNDPLFLGDPENVEIVKISNKEISSLSPENMLLILCIHASGHYWDRLSWICDVSELIQSYEINWEYIFEKADKLGIKRLILVNLCLAVDLLDLNLPNTIHQHLESTTIQYLTFKVKKRIFMPNYDSLFQMADIRFNIREKRSHRIKDFLKIMFLPTNEEWDKSSLKSFFPPFSYFYRFIQVLTNY
ncbi:nucleotidyltransferase family protein [Methanobacterium sp. SMA-27]|uniref:nucleotidyltransferase domain-containing protein n=1 Tax=Methanobacterium sp. SMA-27 TaxID=1495336 RepID=UPI0006931CC8|nr:nucleotidyltransferase family protein [Methanobacterium sp. SMA-27]